MDMAKDNNVHLSTLAFKLGVQGKDVAKEYEATQSSAVRLASVLFRTLLGEQQSTFASYLMDAVQFHGSAWTTGTVICKGLLDDIACNHGDPAKRGEKLQKILDEFDRRLCDKGPESLGFPAGEAGVSEAELYRDGLQRWMRLHADLQDWLNKHEFWDGIACIIKRSSQSTAGVADPFAGALDILGSPNNATSAHDVKSAKRTPLVFHDSLRKPEA